jgi:GH24 family phage-related lysozyme (muramidase)
MDKEAFKQLLENHEGRKNTVYIDTEGHPTIGVGFNLDRGDAKELISDMGLDYDKVRNGSQDLSDAQIDKLLDHDMDTAIATSSDAVSNYDDMSEGRQLAVADMAFNLGGDGLAGFTKAVSAMESSDWETASAEMEDSKWFEQTGTRAEEDVEMMRSGQYSGS